MNPINSSDFDRAYQLPFTVWGDVRIPEEVKALARHGAVQRSLELGCGLGRFSRYLAQKGLRATGVDFSPVAIAKARSRAAADPSPPDFRVGDVTDLAGIGGPFDVSFDVGCFHCLRDEAAEQRYVAEVARLLIAGGTHLIWALDDSPGDVPLDPDAMKQAFAPHFVLKDSRVSRRRVMRSHWYWLVRV